MLFFFPTRGENFGHIIVESLAAGCPVLLSDRTPWTDFDKKGAGWIVPLNERHRFKNILEQVVAMSHSELDTYSQQATQYATDVINDLETLEQNRRLFALEVEVKNSSDHKHINT